MLLEGKAAIVTGGGSGIGRASVVAMAREGARLAVVDRNTEAASSLADELRSEGREADAWSLDVAQESQVQDVIGRIAQRFGRIDALVNSAGVAVRNRVTEQDEASWERCIDINIKGSFLCAKHAIPHMYERGGSIVNISSVTGLIGVRNRSAYATSKGGIVALTKSIAMDYASFQIRSNCVCPGFVNTPLIAALVAEEEKKRRLISMHPLRRLGTPEDVANAVVFFVSDCASWITGQVLAVDGGFATGAHEDI